MTFNNHFFILQYKERTGQAHFPQNCSDCKKASSKIDRHHIPVQRSTTISGLSVIISLYWKTSDDFHCVKNGLIRSFLVRILPHSDWMQRYRVFLLIQSECLNAGKYGPEKLRIWTFTQCFCWQWTSEYMSTSMRHPYKVQGHCYQYNIQSHYINRFHYCSMKCWFLYFAACL